MRNQNIRIAIAATAASLVAGIAAADIIIDGYLDADYGKSPLAIQNTQTQFGDSNLGTIDYANGSELDVAYGFVDTANGYLRLFFGGNLESNFNKLEVFIDYRDGGQNRIRGDNPDVDFNGLNRLGDDGSGNGLTFDADFAADFYVTTTCGGTPFSTYCNTSQMLSKGGGIGEYIGSGGAGAAYLVGSNGTLVGYDNSNTAGVIGGTELGDGSGVTTGIEIALPLALLEGYTTGAIKVSVMVNGGGHDYLSNQVLAGVNGGGNYGEPRLVNFDLVPGIQYFQIGEGGGPQCLGDFDQTGSVDASDLALLLGSWAGPGGDVNDDGTTDASDLALLLGAWGACP